MISTIRSSVCIVLTSIALCACASRVIVKPAPLPLPPRPTLTPIPGSALQCLAPAAYTSLVNRERALRTWGLELESIIQSNNNNAQK